MRVLYFFYIKNIIIFNYTIIKFNFNYIIIIHNIYNI
jgi:hypothetical protein